MTGKSIGTGSTEPAFRRDDGSRTPRQTRRTQAMRTSETKARLIRATLDILFRDGYARATTAEIADMAGVSRGALTHHFESKDDLVAHAVDFLLKSTTSEIAALSDEVRAQRLTIGAFIDKLWDLFSGPLLLITLEHVTEARHNAWLHSRLVPLVRDFHDTLDRIWQRFFEDSGLDHAEVRTTLNATLCLLRGMGVQTVLRKDPEYYRALLDLWKRQLMPLLAQTQR